MRIKSVSLTWFRGAADPVALDCGEKSAVVYGQNGSGKSSFIDAIEYAISDGKLRHLSHEYSGRHQELAIPNTHTPDDKQPEFQIEFADDSRFDVRISRDGTHTRSGADAAGIGTWDYQRTVLRQDEVAAFIGSRKGERYSTLLPLLGLGELEIAAENVRQLVRPVEQQSRLAQNQGVLGAGAQTRQKAFGKRTDAEVEAEVAALHKKYCPNAATEEAAKRCDEITAALKARIDDLTAENQRYLALRTLAGIDIGPHIKAIRDANAQLAESAEPLIAERLEVLQAASPFAAGLAGEKEIPCPACGQAVSPENFKAHVQSEQSRLQAILKIYDERRAAMGLLADDLKKLKNSLGGQAKTWRDEQAAGKHKAQLEWIEACNPESFRRAVTEDDLKAIKDQCDPVITQAGEDSKEAPPDIKDLSKDKDTAESAKAVFDAASLQAEVTRAESLVAFLGAVEAGIRQEIRERATSVITGISKDIGRLWKLLHPHEPIEDVRLHVPADDKAIDIALKFHGKDQNSPRLTLSEGYRNSLGLCIFLAMARQDAEKDRPLFLDDVVVSLDRGHRGMVADLLEKEFGNRQVVLVTHDRDWYSDLRRQLDEGRWSFRTLMPYETPELGIRWSTKTFGFDDARAQLKNDPVAAGTTARKIMDAELALVAEKLVLRLPYLRGDNNDKRSWSDFLEVLKSDGRKCFQRKDGKDWPRHEAGLAALDEAGRLLVTWGNRGAHSDDVVRTEAAKLIEASEKALSAFKCNSCSKNVWFSTAEGAEWVQCQCGDLRWRYGKG